MAISSKYTRAPWDPLDERDRGLLLFWIPPANIPSGRSDRFVLGDGSSSMKAPVSEGSRTGDGTPVSDPYAYENDGTTLMDYRPFSVEGIVPGKGALGFAPSPRGPAVGAFVDDPNTGIASQAPLVPGKMMVASAQENDNGLIAEVDQPTQLLVIFRWFSGASGFSPVLDLNGPNASGGALHNTGVIIAPLRITKINAGGANVSLRQLNSQPAPGEWAAVLWSFDTDQIRPYSAVTGLELANNDPFPASGTYAPPNTETGQTVVHTIGGRRYNGVSGAPERLRQRDFSECQVQEIACFGRRVDPVRVAKYVRLTYPGIENVAVTQ